MRVVSSSDHSDSEQKYSDTSKQEIQQIPVKDKPKKSKKKPKQEIFLSAEVVDSDSELDNMPVDDPRLQPQPSSSSSDELSEVEDLTKVARKRKQAQKAVLELKLNTARLARQEVLELKPLQERRTVEELLLLYKKDPVEVVVDDTPVLPKFTISNEAKQRLKDTTVAISPKSKAFNPIKFLRQGGMHKSLQTPVIPKNLTLKEKMLEARRLDALRNAVAAPVVESVPQITPQIPLRAIVSDEESSDVEPEVPASLQGSQVSSNGLLSSDSNPVEDSQYSDPLVEPGVDQEAPQVDPVEQLSIWQQLKQNFGLQQDKPVFASEEEEPAVTVHKGKIVDSEDESEESDEESNESDHQEIQLQKTEFVEQEADIEDDEHMNIGGVDGDFVEADKVLAKELEGFVEKENSLNIEQYAEYEQQNEEVLKLFNQQDRKQDLDQFKGAVKVAAGKQRGKSKQTAYDDKVELDKFGQDDDEHDPLLDELDNVEDAGIFESIVTGILAQATEKKRALKRRHRNQVDDNNGAAMKFDPHRKIDDDTWDWANEHNVNGHVVLGHGGVINTDVEHLEQNAQKLRVLELLDNDAARIKTSSLLHQQPQDVLRNVKTKISRKSLASQAKRDLYQNSQQSFKPVLKNNSLNSKSIAMIDETSREAQISRYGNVFKITDADKDNLKKGRGHVFDNGNSNSNIQSMTRAVGKKSGFAVSHAVDPSAPTSFKNAFK